MHKFQGLIYLHRCTGGTVYHNKLYQILMVLLHETYTMKTFSNIIFADFANVESFYVY